MLVVTRKVNERIYIGGGGTAEIVVTVVQIQGGQVRLGISAPREIPIEREEIRLRPDYDAEGRRGGRKGS